MWVIDGRYLGSEKFLYTYLGFSCADLIFKNPLVVTILFSGSLKSAPIRQVSHLKYAKKTDFAPI